MTLRPAPGEKSTAEEMSLWCAEAEEHLRSMGFPGYPHDIGVQLAIRGLAACLGIDGDELDDAIALERMRFMLRIMDDAEKVARQRRLTGGIVLPGQNGHPV